MDDGSQLGYLFSAAALILCGGWFAGTEIALASVSKIRMISYSDDGNRKASRVLYILDRFDSALSTLLIGNNIMHLSCASIMTLWAQRRFGSGAVTAVTLVTTLAVFLFSEMIPKAFAKSCSEKFAMVSAGPLILLMKLFTPLNFVFTRLTRLIEKPLGIEEEEDEPTVTQEDLKEIIGSIDEDDDIDSDTSDLVKNVLAFTEKETRSIVTPWDKAVCIQMGMTKEQIISLHGEYGYSRYPVVNRAGNPVGILQIKKYLRACAEKSKLPLSSVMDRPMFVPPSLAADELLRKMSGSRIQMAILRSDDGRTLGIITIEDLLEEIVGEIYDESDEGGSAV